MGAHQDQFRGFAKYNLEFNHNLFDRVSELGDEQRKRDLGAFFGSIHGTLNHILLADRIWLGRFATAFPAMTSLADAALVHTFPSLRHELYADFDELHAQRRATDEVIVRWATELTDTLLATTMRYRTSNGRQREHPAWIAAAHLFNHQTHHRGQVTTLMQQLGVDPGVTDYLVYVQ
ncbi:hypothetical protein FZO89_09825 [Luteimonas viscosa]|uniref:Damage-inducible protein DinB n=1 Tax=Luteimonas viscosa TaxID=1132694 RepID=A0A5D4XR53_9GAMM|nr:DinB family protein [Luteimonas viscosa]TYT26534.1 hypothetical protein FZO89_09825 [Luteimonas viscosa]